MDKRVIKTADALSVQICKTNSRQKKALVVDAIWGRVAKSLTVMFHKEIKHYNGIQGFYLNIWRQFCVLIHFLRAICRELVTYLQGKVLASHVQNPVPTLGTRKRFGRKHLGVDVTFIRKRNGNIVENRNIWDSQKRISSFSVPHASVLFTVCCSKRKYKRNRWVTIHEKQEEVEGLKKDMRTASSRRDIMSSMLGGQRLRLAI